MDVATKSSSEVTLTSSIVQRVLSSARSGEYRSADRLPSERYLAEQLKVSRNTVTSAYAALERLGVIRRIHGKGAFLCALPAEQASFSWSGKISRFANVLDEPVLELLARRCAGEIPYPFSAGTPSLEIFPKDQYAQSLAHVTEASLSTALAVAPTEGQWKLREAIGSWLAAPPQNVMITAGAQEGIDLVARSLVEPGDYVVMDTPSYPGAIQSFLSAGAQLLPWGTDWSL
ncbi:MAG: aminotransferase class I/II-fold pyridoxal phosphate-dependent enzyme, partial [Terriglobus roseus]|nr:aminotransferase class I/II-fold pyridoxal phosphate-dependent enzyme [Terriglobus roseus]